MNFKFNLRKNYNLIIFQNSTKSKYLFFFIEFIMFLRNINRRKIVNISINNKFYSTEKSKNLIELLKSLKIEVPNFCHDKRIMNKTESCGICVVEINGKLVKACETKIDEDMVVKTHSEMVVERRKEILSNLIEDHPLDCLGCEKSGECKLQEYCYEYDVHMNENEFTRKSIIDDSNPFYRIDSSKCIACGKCVSICAEQQCSNGLKLSEENGRRAVRAKGAEFIDDTMCMSCGNCVSVCPVGALLPKTKVSYRQWDTESTITTCSYCGVGCQIEFKVKDNKIVEANPVKGEPNDGLLCVKGKFGYKFVDHPDRLTKPLIRKNGILEEASWEETIEYVTSKMKKIKEEEGPDVFAGLTSARCTNEDNFMFQKLFRAVIGTNNVDHCARL